MSGFAVNPAGTYAERMTALVFSSLPFLFLYLPIVLAVYFLLPKNGRNAFLFAASLVFYAWGEPVYVLLMLFTIAFGWLAGLLLAHWQDDRRKAKSVLVMSLLVNLGILGFFKYGNFVVENVNRIPGLHLQGLNLLLPLGISFYTFQVLSYTIDVYRKESPAQPDFFSFGAYISMFPQLIAGPIVRYHSIALQLKRRQVSLPLFGSGAGLFTVGLAKKVLLANNIGVLWDNIKSMAQGDMTVLAAWAGMAAFGLQLYFDFSGYSDMAVGLGRMLGFHFEQNFFFPYVSRSITEFWRRWHISLGTWFREYLYIPLGGSRHGNRATVVNLLVVWAATGLWHGANWNFMFWGLYYFVFLVCERFLWGNLLASLPKAVRHVYTLLVVLAGWGLFVFEDLDSLGAFMFALGGQAAGGWINERILYYLSSWGVMVLIAAIGATPLPSAVFRHMEEKWPALAAWAKPALMLVGLLLSVAYLVDSSYNPFLYFRF